MKSDISKAKVKGGKVRKKPKMIVSIDPAIKGGDVVVCWRMIDGKMKIIENNTRNLE